ncbi:MAG: hypothetical protein AAF634_12510 [Bacteroidota bacterium]
MKKWLKITLFVLFGGILILIGVIGYGYYHYWGRFTADTATYPPSVEYIDPEKALYGKGFKACNENSIAQYYNPERATYSKGKNGLRKFIMSNYINKGYSDSGYLNIRFVINCKGAAGRYIIHENTLDLEPTELDKDMTNQLFALTRQLKDWNPVFFRGKNRDAYMYLSYRIENGEIVAILP